jgi:hypothetical protein
VSCSLPQHAPILVVCRQWPRDEEVHPGEGGPGLLSALKANPVHLVVLGKQVALVDVPLLRSVLQAVQVRQYRSGSASVVLSKQVALVHVPLLCSEVQEEAAR